MSRRSPNLDKFKAACRYARAAGKHIVALKLGQSEGGRQAAMAHTGSLAGSVEAFDAVAGEVGVIRADTLDDVVEITELLAHTGAPPAAAPRRHHAVGRVPRPAARCRRAQSPAVPAAGAGHDRPAQFDPQGRLAGVAIRSTAASACSPAPRTTWPRSRRCRPIPNVDIVLLQEALPRERRLRPRRELHPRWSRTTRRPRPRSRSPSSRRPRTARPITAARCARRRRMCRSCRKPTRRCAQSPAPSRRERDRAARAARRRRVRPRDAGAARGHRATCARAPASDRWRSTKCESKDVLRAYGIATPAEALVTSPADAVEAAKRIGYPGRAQGGVRHAHAQIRCRRGRAQPRDAGGTDRGLSSAWRKRCATHALAGMLVCQQVRGGLELVLGLHRDPEMGLVVMAGAAACCSN